LITKDARDMRDPATLGAAILALRATAKKLPLARLCDRHRATLDRAGR
jgi:hypothetical protein